VPVPSRRGSRFDMGPHKALALTAEASRSRSRTRSRVRRKDKDKKDKKKDRRDDRHRDRDSRSPSRAKRRKDKDKDRDRDKDKENDRDREREKEKDRAKEREKDRDKEREKEKEKDKESASEPPPIAPKSPEPARPAANGTAAPAAAAAAAPAAAGGDVPDWLSDLFQASPAGPLLPRMPHREVMVPQQFVARLIGRGGEVIMGIVNATGADVKIRQETKDLGYSLAVITGAPEAMDTAERMVRQKLGITGPVIGTKELPIAAEHLGAVLANKAAWLADIRTRSGGLQAEIRPPEVPGMPHRAVLGPGREEQLLIAEQVLTSKIAEAGVQVLMDTGGIL